MALAACLQSRASAIAPVVTECLVQILCAPQHILSLCSHITSHGSLVALASQLAPHISSGTVNTSAQQKQPISSHASSGCETACMQQISCASRGCVYTECAYTAHCVCAKITLCYAEAQH